MKIEEKIDKYLNEKSDFDKWQGKRVIITTKKGTKYGGILHKSSDRKIVLSELVVYNKSGGTASSGSKEKRTFKTDEIKNIKEM